MSRESNFGENYEQGDSAKLYVWPKDEDGVYSSADEVRFAVQPPTGEPIYKSTADEDSDVKQHTVQDDNGNDATEYYLAIDDVALGKYTYTIETIINSRSRVKSGEFWVVKRKVPKAT